MSNTIHTRVISTIREFIRIGDDRCESLKIDTPITLHYNYVFANLDVQTRVSNNLIGVINEDCIDTIEECDASEFDTY